MLVRPWIILPPGIDAKPYEDRAREYLIVLGWAYAEWTNGLELEWHDAAIQHRAQTWSDSRSAALGDLMDLLEIERERGVVDVIWAHGTEPGGAGSYGVALLWLDHLMDSSASIKGNAFWLCHEFLHARGLTHAGNPTDPALLRKTDTVYRWREFSAYGPALFDWEREKLIEAHEEHDTEPEATVPEYEFIDLSAEFTQSPTAASHTRTAIHHTTGEAMNVIATEGRERAFLDSIDLHHRDVRGWPYGIGYHDVAFVSGRVYRVGNPNTQRTHVGGHNHVYHGLALAGSWETEEPPAYMYEILAQHIVAQGLPTRLERHGSITGSACPGMVEVEDIQTLVDALDGPAQPPSTTTTHPAGRAMTGEDASDIWKVTQGHRPVNPTSIEAVPARLADADAWHVERRR